MAEARRSKPRIFPDGEVAFVGDVGEAIELAARALRPPALGPARGVRVRFEVVAGPLRLGPRRTASATASTDSEGRAVVRAVFTERGAAIVAVDRAGGDHLETVFLGGHSDGMAHRVIVHAPPTASAAEGAVRVLVAAVDSHEELVPGADLVLEASPGDDRPIPVQLTPLDTGEFEGVLRTSKAASWRLRALDRATNVIGDARVQVTPGPARALRVVGDPDPRRSPPFSRLWLRTRLEDEFGNALEPHRIQCAVEGANLVATVRAEEEARFLLDRKQGGGAAVADLSDAGGTDVVARQEVLFSAAWIGDPGFASVEERFRTPVYLMPAPGSPVNLAKVTVAFDAELTRFVALEPSPGPPGLEAEADIDGANVIIDVTTERPIDPELVPDGLEIGVIEWECTGEGDTCFEVSVEMSPASEPWKLCVSQKRARQKCICINIIYRSGAIRALEAGVRATRSVVPILSTTNIRRCCPSLRIRVRRCAIRDADWRNKVIPAVGADQRVNTFAEVEALFGLMLCQRPKCINFLMIAMDPRYADGDAGSIGPRAGGDRSFGVINPDSVDSVHNIGAHEVGHALGLEHVADAQGDNVMSETQPHGDKLTEAQCQTLFSNLDAYAC